MRRSALSARRAPARGRGQALRGRVRRQLVRIQSEAFEGVGESAPGMGPARQVHQPLVAHHRQTAAVAVGVQRAGEPCEQAFGHVARTGRVILEQHDGRVGAGTHLRPELGLRLSALAGLIEHLHGGLVHQQVGAVEQFIAQQVEERDHECAGAHHPRGQRGAREVHADALELLVLAIQWQGIGVLRGGHVGEQSGAGEALGQGLRGHRGGAQMALAVRAAVLAAHMAQHPHLGRDDVELLADHLAEAFELDPVVRAGPLVVGQRMLDVDARQGIGQRGALRGGAPMGRDLGARGGLGLLGGAGLGLVEQPELPVGELLRRGREAPGKQQAHLRFQMLDSRIALGEFGFVVTHPREQRADVVGQGLAEGRRRGGDRERVHEP